jgi:hypothetical protein
VKDLKQRQEEERKQQLRERALTHASTFACYADALSDSIVDPMVPRAMRAVPGLLGFVLACGWIGDDVGEARPILANVARITGCMAVDQEDGRPDPVDGRKGMSRVRLSYKRAAGLPDTVTLAAPFDDATSSIVRAMGVAK